MHMVMVIIDIDMRAMVALEQRPSSPFPYHGNCSELARTLAGRRHGEMRNRYPGSSNSPHCKGLVGVDTLREVSC